MFEDETIVNNIIDVEISNEINKDVVPLNENVPSKHKLTHTERVVAELSADRKTVKEIANEMEMACSEVRSILKKPQIKDFIKELVNAQLDMTKEYRLTLINRIIEDKIKRVEEELEGDFSKATKKDIVDLLQVQDYMLKEREKKELGTTEDTYVTILQKIIKQ